MLLESLLGIQLQLGMVAFHDEFDNQTTRAALGLTADANIFSMLHPEKSRYFVGPSTGVIFSHLGAPNSNFFGSNSNYDFSTTANLVIIPVDLKVGCTITPNTRISLRAGGNVIYQSVGNSLNMGPYSPIQGPSPSWKFYFNLGLDFEAGVGENFLFMIRPDATLTGGNDIYSGTLGFGFRLR